MNQLEFLGNRKSTSETMPDPKEMEMLMKYCEVMAQAPAYASMGGMPGIFALVMTARELGIGPMSALNGGMYLIPPGLDKEGKPKGSPTIMMAAKTMSMMIWKCGHKIEIIEANDNAVTLKGTRADNGVSMIVTMNMAKAKQAQLSHDGYGKPKLWSTWFKNSEDMLWKTCVAKLGRRLFTDVIGNAYEPSEFEEKEAKEKLEKVERKTLKGKNMPEVNECKADLQIEHAQNALNLDNFIEIYRLDPNSELRNKDLIEFVSEVAKRRKEDYTQTLQYCLQNIDGFIKAYNMHANEKGLEIVQVA